MLAIYICLENWPFCDGLNIYCLKIVHSVFCDFSQPPPLLFQICSFSLCLHCLGFFKGYCFKRSVHSCLEISVFCLYA